MTFAFSAPRRTTVRGLSVKPALMVGSPSPGARAAAIVEKQVYPALDRQISLMRQLRPSASSIAGVWRLPHGDEIYAAALEQARVERDGGRS